MRIALPVEDDQTKVSMVFGRAPYYLIYDTENKSDELKKNPAAESSGGAGIQAAQFIVDSKVDVLITPRCGENSAEVLNEAEVKIFKSEGNDVATNLTAFQENKLSLLDHFHAGYHGIK